MMAGKAGGGFGNDSPPGGGMGPNSVYSPITRPVPPGLSPITMRKQDEAALLEQMRDLGIALPSSPIVRPPRGLRLSPEVQASLRRELRALQESGRAMRAGVLDWAVKQVERGVGFGKHSGN